MKKVGIITLAGLDNYGNRLQAYALSRVIEKLNYIPFEILYCKRNLKTFLLNAIKMNSVINASCCFLISILRKENLACIIKKCSRLYLFSRFFNKRKIKLIFGDNDTFDYYLCGSDQIWNPDFAGHLQYFADFAVEEKRISYAASFGVNKLPEDVVERYKKSLSEMKCISVRENSGVQIVRELTGKDACVVIDPTLMLDTDDWKKVSKKPRFNVPDNYILVYFLGELSDEISNYIKRLSEENNLKIIVLHKQNKNDYWYYTGPSEFVWLIENASLVCTDSFHASVFSILMNSPSIAFRRISKHKDMHSRFDSLLGMFKLTDRFFENIEIGNEFNKDYSHIPEILKFEREKAVNYLLNAFK